MKPGVNEMKVNRLLTQFSIAYRNAQYINDLIMPRMQVTEKTGNYAKYGTENFRANLGNIYRAPGTRAVAADYSVSQGEYSCKEKSIEKKVPWEMQKNVQLPYNAKRDATQMIMDMILVNQEKVLRDYMTSTSNLPLNITLTGTDQWNDYANSDPFDDIETAITTVFTTTGTRPNTMVISYDVFRKLKTHPDVREAMKYTNGGQPSETDMGNYLKQYFSLSNVYVGTAHCDTTVEGQTASLSAIWTKDVWVMYVAPTPSLMMPTFGMTFEDVPREVDEYTETALKSDFVRVSASYDQNVCNSSLAYLIKNAIA